jgi:uncharacterized protein
MNLKLAVSVVLLVFFLSVAQAQNTTSTKIIGVRELSDGTFEGAVANLTVQVRPGTGHVFIDTLPLTQIDTQASARLARAVACEVMVVECNSLDFFFIIRSDTPMIGGPSAGLVLTMASMAALQGVPMNQDVLATGTINPGGSVGPVGSLPEKAVAAEAEGAQIFLIPSTEASSLNDTVRFDMQVVPVSDVLDAYKYATGYLITRKKVSSEEIASKKFEDAMRLLSDVLLTDAQEEYDDVEQTIATSTIPKKNLDQIKENFKVSESTLESAVFSTDNDQFYSSSSFAVRSLINTLYVKRLLAYYELNESSDYVLGKIADNKKDIEGFEKSFLQDRTVDSIDDIEIFAVAIDRLRESEELIADAEEAALERDNDAALYLSAFAEVRRDTAYYWLTLASEFKGTESFVFNQEDVRETAQERIEQSRNHITYAQTVAQNTVLLEAIQKLDNAEQAFAEGKYVFALFEASKARAEATLSMEVRGATNETITNLLDSYTDGARLSIKQAEEQGLLPILALSYLEFANSLRETEPFTALVYLSYSKEMSKISVDIVNAITREDLLPEQGVTITQYYESIVRFDPQNQVLQNVLLLISGALAGIISSFFIFERMHHRKKR